MFYATITICLAAVGICDIDHSIWNLISDPVFNTIDICHQESINLLHNIDLNQILKEGEDYVVNINCMSSV